MRFTQMITYLNAKVHPTSSDKVFYYTHFEITEQAKKIRKEYRKALKALNVDEKLIAPEGSQIADH